VGAEYFLGGSLASSLQGEPRATNDIDFVMALPLGKIGELAGTLGSDFEVDTDLLRDAILRARCANAFYLPIVTKIELFGRGYEPFDESELSRRRTTIVTASGDSRGVKTPEDTVLRKLLWFREGGEVSEKQWRDIVSVLQISGHKMDPAYLTGWASRLMSATYSNALAASRVSSTQCTRRDLNPHALRRRNLNPVGMYRDAVRCSETRISPRCSLHLASFRYRRWTIQRRFTRASAAAR
jgi:hypothetical protein